MCVGSKLSTLPSQGFNLQLTTYLKIISENIDSSSRAPPPGNAHIDMHITTAGSSLLATLQHSESGRGGHARGSGWARTVGGVRGVPKGWSVAAAVGSYRPWGRGWRPLQATVWDDAVS